MLKQDVFDSLLPDFSCMTKTEFGDKADLIDKMRHYKKEKFTIRKSRLEQMRSPSLSTISHYFFNLAALFANKHIGYGFRFIVNTSNQLVLSMEGLAGHDIPAHRHMANINLDSKNVPEFYDTALGSTVLAAGRIFLNKNREISEIDSCSGWFRTGKTTEEIALAILILCAKTKLANPFYISILDNSGRFIIKHPFSPSELEKIILPQLTEEDEKELFEKNSHSVSKIVHITRRGKGSLNIGFLNDMSEYKSRPSENTTLSISSINPSPERGVSRSLLDSPRTTPARTRCHSSNFDSPTSSPTQSPIKRKLVSDNHSTKTPKRRSNFLAELENLSSSLVITDSGTAEKLQIGNF